MKKVLSLLAAVVLVTLTVLPVFAADESQMIISTSSTNEVWTLYFPADTQIPWESETYGIGEVKSEKLQIEPGKVLTVSVTSQNDYKLVNTMDAQKTIEYTLSGADDISFLPGEVNKSFELTVSVTDEQWGKAAAGEHTDLLTFQAECVNI